MIVLSLFDGMSCGQLALKRAGVHVNKYYASEIKSHAIKVTQHNFPETIQVGDVTEVSAKNLPKVDLLIGGSPCQDFSNANKERLGLNGPKSSLFFEFVRLLRECEPKYFLLENVAMTIEDNNFISGLLGVLPVRINSNLVSAQNRDRFYWTNIPGEGVDLFGTYITQPKDAGIVMSDVVDGYYPTEKSHALLARDGSSWNGVTAVKMFHRFYAKGFGNVIFKSEQHYLDCKSDYDSKYDGIASHIDVATASNVYEGLRVVNRRECERLQTVPEGYTDCVSNAKAINLLGDGWTVDVIAHIFKGLP
jgi:site-specific DNA-cytosine methylase